MFFFFAPRRLPRSILVARSNDAMDRARLMGYLNALH